jgi:PAS domain S-box-containing protein
MLFRRDWRTAGLALALTALVGAGALSYAMTQRITDSQRDVEDANGAVIALERTLSDLKDAQQAQGRYILTGDVAFLPTYDAAPASIAEQLASARRLVGKNATQRARLDTLQPQIDGLMSLLDHSIALRASGSARPGDQSNLALATQSQMEVIRRNVTAIEDVAQAEVDDGRSSVSAAATTTLIVTSAMTALAVLVIGASFWLFWREMRRRRESERETEAALAKASDLYENAPCGYHSLDDAGVFTAVNATELRWLGYEADELIGRMRFDDLVSPESRTRLQEEIPDEQAWHARFPSFKSDATIPDIEFELIRKDGSRFPVLMRATLERGPEGTFVSSRATVFDVTSRREADNRIAELNLELQRHTLELEASNKELEAFCYSVSHDLRSPLRTIDGFGQALAEDYEETLGEDGKHLLSRIRAATQRMGQLIDDLLKLSRMTRVEFQRSEIDLSALAADVAGELRSGDAGSAAEVVIAPGAKAEGDARLARVVLENLLGNAWKYSSRAEEPRIEFGFTERAGERVFFVKDNGAGFDMTYAQKLFGVFQRLHSVNEFPGTGVGLAIVQRVVHRHGGRVWAEAEVGKGATFYFTLAPAVEALAAAA